MTDDENTHWRIRRHLLHTFEIATDALTGVVPRAIDTAEVRPGVSLFVVDCMQYHADHFTPGAHEFFEIVFGVAVQPDLRIRMPVPRFCIYAASILSDSAEFIERECRPLFEPSVLAPGLRIDFSADGTSCDVFDGDRPIVSLRNAEPPVFEAKTLWGQYYTDTNGLRQGIWRWQGELFEHMKPSSSVTFHPHPFFKGVELRGVRRAYRQMAAKPDTVSTLSRWLPGVAPT